MENKQAVQGAKRKTEVSLAITAWDLYASGSYEEIRARFNGKESLETQDIRGLAGLELGEKLGAHASKGPFASLLEGMNAYHEKNDKLAAQSLGSWLLKKDFFNSLILRRFIAAARKTENYSLLYAVARKHIDNKAYRETLAGPLLYAAYQLKKYAEVTRYFETYREFYRDRDDLQLVSFSLMRLGRYADAERFMLSLYKKIRGADYQLNYEKVRESYQPLIKRIPEIEKQGKKLNREERMELGMAYLFNSEYRKALKIFEALRQ